MDEIQKIQYNAKRRDFLLGSAIGLGGIALQGLIGCKSKPEAVKKDNQISAPIEQENRPLVSPHFMPTAKRVIYLFQSGGPSQMELFDYKPMLYKMHGKEIPPSVMGTNRVSGMTSNQYSFPLAMPACNFSQHGSNSTYLSELIPHTASIVDELCIIKSMVTDQINHEPAMIFTQTGNQLSGRPCIGSWLSYGLGSMNQNLPAFIVMLSKGGGDQPISSAAWSSGFLPSYHQGVQFLSVKDPVLFLKTPDGVERMDRRRALDFIKQFNIVQNEKWQDPEIESQITQAEMAYKMQMAVPDILDLSKEPKHILDMYGPDVTKPGTFAHNCITARRLIEKDVRFVQLYHLGWDHHGRISSGIRKATKQTDQASAALVKDLKQRGLLDDTLVIWGGEFGRTSFSQGKLTPEGFGRDHHPGAYTTWMAGGGVKPGLVYGQTDDFAHNVVRDKVHVHDFQATLLYMLGIDHEKFIYKNEGRRYRLTDVHGHVIKDILA
ncbi:MAG: sulfatase [Bacteroidetes bacterium B1(2017)]|nr:MAG: sulfatase [Bacteroidetes bacterium B1(2017)]